MFDFDFIRRQIDFKYEYGIRDFEISGGEPSEYAELRRICEYIKQKDSNSKIAIITNGGLWKSQIWDIIDEVLVSYHISQLNANIDSNIFPLGNTYCKVKKTIDIAKDNQVIVRTNTVLGTFNVDDLAIVDDLMSFRPNIINFLPLNLFDNAVGLDKYIDYDSLSRTLDIFINKINEQLPNCLVFVRYVPYCVLEKHKQHIVGHIQHIYDWFDWNRELDGTNFLEIIRQNKEEDFLKYLGTYGSRSIEYAMNDRKSLYVKTDKCIKCKYQIICDGLDKTLNNQNALEKYIKPIYGPIVKNCLEYSKDVTYKYYHEQYLENK